MKPIDRVRSQQRLAALNRWKEYQANIFKRELEFYELFRKPPEIYYEVKKSRNLLQKIVDFLRFKNDPDQ